MVFKITSGNHINIQGQCDLDLKPHLLVITNHLVKIYENLMINSFQENKQKPL